MGRSSLNPSRRSIARIALLTAGCEMPRKDAAPVIVPLRITAWKISSWRAFMPDHNRRLWGCSMSSVDGPAEPVIVDGTATGALCRHGHARWRGYWRHLHRLLPVGRDQGGAAQPQGAHHAADAWRRAAAWPRPAAGTPRRQPI